MDPFIGQIELFPFLFTPMDWIPCDGRLLNVTQYQALYSLLGTKFGGNGSTTFGIPDLRNASPNVGMTYCIALSGLYPMRE